jgi:peptide/nickel transport system substrate-binding protein
MKRIGYLFLGRVIFSAMMLWTVGAKTTVAAAETKRELRITFAWPIYIDPAVGSDYASSSGFVNLYDTLVYPTPDGNVKPHTAERWEVSADGLTWTFYLRKGVKFHNGNELTAEDVAFSMDRLTTIGEGYGYLFQGKVKSSEVVDNYTVKFHMNEPYGPFLTTLVRLYILNKKEVLANLEKPGQYGDMGDYGKKYLLTHDCGSGPYKVKEIRLEEYLLMERFKEYWGEIAPNAADEVKFIGTTEAVTVRTMMARRELEISDPWQTVESLKSLDALDGVDLTTIFTGGVFYYMLHNRKAPTDDIHFRKAMAWAVDYQNIIDQIFPGSRPVKGPIATNFPGSNPDVFQYQHDLNKAKEELQQSPYANQLAQYPVEVHWAAEVPDEEKAALLFMANMAEIGIQVKIVKTPWLSMVEEMAKQETSPSIETIFVSPHYAEAGSLLASRYHSKSAPTWEQNEWLLDKELDAMIDGAIATIDREARFAKYREIQKRLVDLCPSLFLFEQAERYAYQSAYVVWPAAKGQVPQIMGYAFDARQIQVYPEKKPK